MQSGSRHKGAKISWSLLSVGKVIFRCPTCGQQSQLPVSKPGHWLLLVFYEFCPWAEDMWIFLQTGGNPRIVARRVPHCPACSSSGRSSGFQIVTLLWWALEIDQVLMQLPVYDASKAQLLSHGVKDGAGCHLAARWSSFHYWTPQCLNFFLIHPKFVQLFGWSLSLHCKQSCRCGENTNDGAKENSQVWFLSHKKSTFASRSSLGLPVQSSYGETMPHTYFKSSLRCGLHTVFLILFTKLPEIMTKVST